MKKNYILVSLLIVTFYMNVTSTMAEEVDQSNYVQNMKANENKICHNL